MRAQFQKGLCATMCRLLVLPHIVDFRKSKAGMRATFSFGPARQTPCPNHHAESGGARSLTTVATSVPANAPHQRYETQIALLAHTTRSAWADVCSIYCQALFLMCATLARFPHLPRFLGRSRPHLLMEAPCGSW